MAQRNQPTSQTQAANRNQQGNLTQNAGGGMDAAEGTAWAGGGVVGGALGSALGPAGTVAGAVAGGAIADEAVENAQGRAQNRTGQQGTQGR